MLSFVKYHGAGNDFILIDDRALSFNPQLVPSLCHRKFGIGADGVILLQNHPDADFRMRIFNNDGTEAESCGNGLRCLMRFIADLGLPQKPTRIATANRIVSASFINDKISVEMGLARDVKQLYINNQEVHFLDTGVPHAVIFVPHLDQINLPLEGKILRYHESFSPCGANVNFAKLLPNGSIQVRTYERGLEAESFACGTGAVAVAITAAKKHNLTGPIQIHFPGGQIEVQIEEGSIYMTGDAVRVFSGSFKRS